MSMSGYKMIFKQPISQITSDSDIDTIRSNCNENTIMCLSVGHFKNTQLQLKVLACGNCLIATGRTQSNTPVFNGAVWWFYTPDDSFGFSSNSIIAQNASDIITDSFLSLRVLANPNIKNVTNFNRAKYVYIKDIPTSIS